MPTSPLFLFQIGSIRSLSKPVIAPTSTMVSIPDWFDQKDDKIYPASLWRNVSIPDWFDQKNSTFINKNQNFFVSIPDWFDQKPIVTRFSVRFSQVSIPDWFDQKSAISSTAAMSELSFYSRLVRLEDWTNRTTRKRRKVSIPDWFDQKCVIIIASQDKTPQFLFQIGSIRRAGQTSQSERSTTGFLFQIGSIRSLI